MNMHPETPSGEDRPDVLRTLYHEAVAQDRGPSGQSSAAILAHARRRAAGMDSPLPGQSGTPAANDRFWLGRALGGLAAIGLAGWLMLQHAAWWDGPGKGPESGAPRSASADPPSAQTHKSTEREASVQAELAPDAKGTDTAVSASGSAPLSAAAPAASAAAAARTTPQANARPRGADAAPAADVPAPQDPARSAPLPPCPLQTEARQRLQDAKEGADQDSAAARKMPHCRPRNPEQWPPAHSEAGQGASEDVAAPQR